jgi:hypothetical protein
MARFSKPNTDGSVLDTIATVRQLKPCKHPNTSLCSRGGVGDTKHLISFFHQLPAEIV